MLKKIKLIILFFLLSICWSYYTQTDANIYFEGNKVNLSSSYIINNNRLCIPLKELSTKIGFTYKKEGTSLFVGDGDFRTVKFLTSHDQVMVGEASYHMSDKSFAANEDWYVPLGYYAWYMGYTMTRSGNNYYISKRLVDISADNESIKFKFASRVDDKALSLIKIGEEYFLDFNSTVLSFPRKVLSNIFASQIIIGQITTAPDLAKLNIKSSKPLFLSKSADNEIMISQKKVDKVLVVKEEVVIPQDVDSIKVDKVSEKAVWIPSFEGVKNIILSVKGKKSTLSGGAVYRDGQYLVPADNVLLPFGFSYEVSDSGILLVKYGDKPVVDTTLKVYTINRVVYVPLQKLARRLGFGLRWDYRIHTLIVNPIITDITFNKNNNGDSIFINSFVEIEPRDMFMLDEPSRIILDIPNAVVDVTNPIMNVEGSNVQVIKAAQFDEETVRVVIQLKKHMNYGMSISDDGTKVSILRSGSVDKVWYEEFKKYNLLSIFGSDMGKINWEQDGNKLEIDIPNATYKAKGEYYFNDPILEKIVGSQYSWDPVSSRMSIYFKTKPKIAVEQLANRIDIRIEKTKGVITSEKPKVVAPRDKPVSLKVLSGKKIVIEAGHGGIDVGAIGFGGKHEKWFTLDTANRLKDVLSFYGATVLMPLRNDTSMSLSGRTQFANRNNADLFISVHYNAFHMESIGGTSTYYYGNTSFPVAKAVHREILSSLGLRDVGLIQKRFFVLFHSQMPAILIEPCFITNQREYEMLLKPENRDKIANAVAKGVVAYYKR